MGTGVGADDVGDDDGVDVGKKDGIRLGLTDGAGLIVGNDVSIDGSEHHWTSLSAVQLLPNDIFPPESEILIEASLRRRRPTETSVSTIATAPGCTLPSI